MSVEEVATIRARDLVDRSALSHENGGHRGIEHRRRIDDEAGSRQVGCDSITAVGSASASSQKKSCALMDGSPRWAVLTRSPRCGGPDSRIMPVGRFSVSTARSREAPVP